MNQYAVTKKNGACLLTTNKEEAFRVGEKHRSEVKQINRETKETKIIAFPLWRKGEDAQSYYTKGAKFTGLVIDE